MQLKQLQQFVAIAECGSLHLAARRLGMSQPALTKAMRHLEDELGTPLLLRGIRGTTLTSFGNAFLPRARAVEAEVRQAVDELSEMRGDARNSLSIAVSPVAAIAILPAALRTFRLRNREAMVRVVDGQPSGAALLRAGTVNLYVGTLETGESGRDLSSEEICSNEVAVMCRIGHPLQRARRLKDLAGAEWVGGVVSQRRDSVRRIFIENGLQAPRSITQCESFVSLISLVATSDLLTILPVRTHASGLFAGMLQPIALEERMEIPPVGILTRADAPQTSILKAFIRALRQASR